MKHVNEDSDSIASGDATTQAGDSQTESEHGKESVASPVGQYSCAECGAKRPIALEDSKCWNCGYIREIASEGGASYMGSMAKKLVMALGHGVIVSLIFLFLRFCFILIKGYGIFDVIFSMGTLKFCAWGFGAGVTMYFMGIRFLGKNN